MHQSSENDPNVKEDAQNVTTDDSRFHADCHMSGTRQFYCMYSGNVVVEFDGLAYSELNILRALILQPFVKGAVYYSSLMAYIVELRREETPQPGPMTSRFPFSVTLCMAFIIFFNILRIVCTTCCLLLELCAWPVRMVLGALLSPITTSFSAGYLFARRYEAFIRPGCTTRRIRVRNSVYCRVRSVPASFLGKVVWFETINHSHASYIASVLKLQQRCGTGPECILLDGTNVFVSWWRPWTITSFVRGSDTEWNLWDVCGMAWRRIIFEMDHDEESNLRKLSNDVEGSDVGFKKTPIKFSPAVVCGQKLSASLPTSTSPTPYSSEWSRVRGSPAFSTSDESCGEISTLYELEEYYNSPLGWNKYHRMTKEGNKIRVSRPDRRIMSHLLALLSSLSLYLWYKDSSKGRFGLFIDLHALIVANYAFITAYAGEILVGKYSEVVDAKSERYGIIVTRAIDQGYVRGFHVPNGNWLIYKNGEKGSEVHKITKTEVNATCNSVVKDEGIGMRIKVIGYDDQLVDEFDWVED